MAQFNAPPWTPDMDARSAAFLARLREENYDNSIDDLGLVRWPSDWRMHVGNGCGDEESFRRVSVNVDEIRAGLPQTTWPAGQYDVPWTPGLDVDATDFFDKLDNLYLTHQKRNVDDTGICRWSSDYRIARANGLSHDAAWRKIERDILGIWGKLPPVTECLSPIVGIARQGNLFALNGRPVTPQLSSEFNLLRMRRTNPDFYHVLLDDVVRYRMQGSRVFTNVGGWMGFWAPDHGVYADTFTPWEFDRKDGHLRPATDSNGQPRYGATIQGWPDYDEQFVGMLEDFARRKLVLHLTAGDAQILYCDLVNNQPIYRFEKEMAHHQRVTRLIKRSGLERFVAFREVRNEYPMNSPGGGTIEDMRRIAREIKGQLPGTLVGLGAALSEEPDKLKESVEGFDVCFQHTSRDPFELCLKRTLGLWYWEGARGTAFEWPFMNGEPKPMNVPPFGDAVGDDGYAPTDRIDQLIALHAMIACTRQGGNMFTGASVRLQTRPSLMPGYKEIPKILAEHVPEDVATWGDETAGNGAILYFTKGKQFLAPTNESWNTNPPRPVASWKVYTGRGQTMEVLEGTGNPPQGRTGFVVGTFK